MLCSWWFDPAKCLVPIGILIASLCCRLAEAQYGHIRFNLQWLIFEIICPAKPLDGWYGNEKSVAEHKWSKANFSDSLLEICSAHSKNHINYQGHCAPDIDLQNLPNGLSEVKMQLRFSKGVAEDHGLYDERTFQHCWNYCYCQSAEEIVRNNELNMAEENIYAELDEAKKRHGITSVSLPEDEVTIPNTPPIANAAVQLSMPETCPTSSRCIDYRCPQRHSRNRNAPRCVCKVKPKGTSFSLLGCGAQARRSPFGGRKREVMEDICPCNGTYVSRKCCDTDDGLVWEAPELKLGEMILDEV